MPKLTVVVGLPGSGKSALLRATKDAYSGLCVPDYQAKALHDSAAVTASRFYNPLIHALRGGRHCVIADVAFTDTGKRIELETIFRRDVEDLLIEWKFFANDLERCLRNIGNRDRPMRDREEVLARELSELYFIPVGATVLDVWRPALDEDAA